jgi:hypothetical protein
LVTPDAGSDHLQLFDLMEKFVERARNLVAGQPLVYDPGDNSLPLLVVPGQTGTNPTPSFRIISPPTVLETARY